MISIGIDVAKNKHDCCMINSNGEVLEGSFTIANNKEGFNFLLEKINKHISYDEKMKVGLEATGHYTKNLLHFLYKKGFCIYLINPLQTDLYRKATSLRKTKTDKIDAYNIALLLFSGINLKPYTKKSYQTSILKELTRSRFATVKDCSRQKVKFSKLIDIVFPELNQFFKTVNCNTVYELFIKYPNAQKIAKAHLNSIFAIIKKGSNNYICDEKIIKIHNAAKNSIGTCSIATTIEIQQTISILQLFNEKIKELDSQIEKTLHEVGTHITSIPGVGSITGASIIAEIGDFSLFSCPDKIQAFAGISPTTYQSGNLVCGGSRMEKRGSKFLRYSILLAARGVVNWNEKFREYMNKKLSEGKHYYVALSHVAKKLIRLIFSLEKNGQEYITI